MNAQFPLLDPDSPHAGSKVLGIRIPYLEQLKAWTWGIDFSTNQADVAMLPPKSGAPQHLSIPLPTNNIPLPERMHQTFSIVIRELLPHRRSKPPAVSVLEQPSGKFVHPTTRMTYSALMVALQEIGVGILYCVPPSSWKRSVIGTGSATKQASEQWFRMTFDRDPADDNHSDATAMAAYARALVQLAEPEEHV